MNLAGLLNAWKTIDIARSFIGALARGWSLTRGSGAITEVQGPAGLKNAFFDEKVAIGSRVRLGGRLTRYCPIYFPVAYSPQVQLNPEPNLWVAGHNPAPTAMVTRTGSGDAIGFLFNERVGETPRVISPFHLDRLGPIPSQLSEPGIPVLVDWGSERSFEELVTIEGVVAPLDSRIVQAITGSHEDVIKSYYHAFYQETFYPVQGFVLDARSKAGGVISPRSEIAPFETSVAIEFKYSAALAPEDIESAISAAFGTVVGAEGAARYQPAYQSPPGYRVVQFSEGGLIAHVAPELGVLNVAVIIDTLNPDRDLIRSLLIPGAVEILRTIRNADQGAAFEGLFASSQDFFRQVGIQPLRSRSGTPD